MDWQIIVALTIALPIILLPVAVVWYINGAGLYQAFGTVLQRRRVDGAGPPGVVREVEVERNSPNRQMPQRKQ